MLQEQVIDCQIVSRETISAECLDKLKEYHLILKQWASKINIVAGDKEWGAFLRRHVLDCAQLASFIPSKATSIIDIGSGAGLPGMILAILGFHNLCMIERNKKKAAFLNFVAAKLEIKTTVFNRDVCFYSQKAEVVTSRAVADVLTILNLTENIREENGKILLLKSGQQIEAEIHKALSFKQFKVEQFPSFCSSEGVIVKLTNIRR